VSRGSIAKFGDPSVKAYPVSSFGRGLNKAVLSYYVRDEHIVDAENVEFSLSGGIKPRKGMARHDDATGAHYTDGSTPRTGWRYNKANGERELIFQASSTVWAPQDRLYADNNSGSFSALDTTPAALQLYPNDDGTVCFEQWRDVLYIVSRFNVMTYNKSESPLLREASNSGYTSGQFLDISLPGGGLNLDTSLNYIYQFTFERYHGDVFLSESPALYWSSPYVGSFGPTYERFYAGPASTAHNGTINIVKYTDAYSLPEDVKYVNVYRTLGLSTDAANDYENQQRQFFDFYYLGRFTRDEFEDASVGTTMYSDTGDIDLDTATQITYASISYPPGAKFAKTYKNRMWLANIYHGEYGDGWFPFPSFEYPPYLTPIGDEPSGIYFSDYNEPEKFRLTSFFYININDGEPITAFERFENKHLVVWKSNSMWAIYGADDELAPGVPDIMIDAIDESVGCVAHGSVAYGEGGLIWLSNKGVYFYNGTRPVPMASELIDPILENISPARKQNATGVYTQKRKYLLSFTDETEDGSANTVTLEYDFVTQTWTRKQFGNPTVYGVNDYVEARRNDEAGVVYALLNTTDSAVGSVQKLDVGQVDAGGTSGVSWSFSTKHFDCGIPDVIKHFKALIIRMRHTSTFTIDYNIDDGCRTGSLPISPLACNGDSAHVWDETDLNWQGSPIENDTFFWSGAGQGGAGSQQDYVINIPETSSPQGNPIGKRIQFEFSGTATSQGQEIQGITILYVPEMRVSNA